MAQANKGAWELFQRVQRDQGATYWLQSALQQMVKRDPLDALRDAEVLHEFCRMQLGEIEAAAIAARQGKLAIVPPGNPDGTARARLVESAANEARDAIERGE